MALSSDLISQLVKVNKEPKQATESTSYGTAVINEGKTYVQLDGSDLLTPVASTCSVKDGDRVSVLIKNHTATITGNLSDPSASSYVVKEQGSQISEFEIIVAHKVTANEIEAVYATIENLRAITAKIDNIEVINAEIDKLEARLIDVDHLTATDITAANAQIEHIEAMFGEFTNISAEDLKAVNAYVAQLKAYTAEFTYVSTEVLEAMKADIHTLDTKKLSAESAEIKYANIDFANIGEAAIRKLFSDTGLIKDLVVGDSTITGELVGVTIKGDLIEGNTIKADKLVVKGSDGIYYKLNIEAGEFTGGEAVPTDSLHGSVITAKSITAEKVSVKDLVAFGATIGGFTIKDHSLYSGVKESATNTTRGVFLGDDGQVAFGDSSNFMKYYEDSDGQYKLEISADSILIGANNRNVESNLNDINAQAWAAQQVADSAAQRVAIAEATLQILSDCIKMLVVDESGESLMTQTGDGWTFSMGSYNNTLSSISENLDTLTKNAGNTQNAVDVLNSAIGDIGKKTEYITITTRNGQPCIELGNADSNFKVRITNTDIQFVDGSTIPAYLSNQKLYIEKAEVKNELQFGNFVWKIRSNGNLGITWNGGAL